MNFFKLCSKVLTLSVVISIYTFAKQPDWTSTVVIPKGENRENIYGVSAEELDGLYQAGLKHALVYPVTVSGLFIPYRPLKNFFETKDETLVKLILSKLGKLSMDIDSVEGMYRWLGLNEYNDATAKGIYRIPIPEGHEEVGHMGASVVNTKWGKGLTFSCATCHTGNLFGTTVMGLTNKATRANKMFVHAKKFVPFIPSKMFKNLTDASDKEVEMLKRTRKNLRAVDVRNPKVLGLDTSLPQVALSLSRRNKDDYATKSRYYQMFPRMNQLSWDMADSKPMPWWNLKYKTRWLSDGSIVAGNPIFTNFLWNELGRGTDLKELENWMRENPQTIKELTAAAFATKAPRIEDFFGVERINIEQAKRGEEIYQNRCQKCHGQYIKKWSLDYADLLPKSEQLKNHQVIYHERTPVIDVGTDPKRYEGTKHFAQALNDLKISQWMKTVVVPQKGYVPPPLDGIWSRYPYMHNNAIPNLCELMTHPDKRVKLFYQTPSDNREEDFDYECNGLPTGNAIPAHRKKREALFDTRKPGLSNSGHYYRIFTDKEGNELLTEEQKHELRLFLLTL